MTGPAPPPEAPEEPYELGPEWRPSKNLWVRFRDGVRGNYPLQAGLLLLGGFLVVGVWAVLRFGHGLEIVPNDPALLATLSPPGPGSAHPFGTVGGLGKPAGFDVLASLIQATPIDLALIGGSILLAVATGLLMGAYAGLVGGPVDLAVTLVSDLLATVPPFFFVMVLFLGLQPFLQSPSYLGIFAGLYAIVLWPYHARPVRARALQIAGEPYVEAARAAGSATGRILRRHVIPNSVSPLLAQIPVDVYNFLFVLTVFPFLGCFGTGFFQNLTPLPPATGGIYPEWGNILATGACVGWSPINEINFWWMYAFPAAVVVLFGISVALVCDGTERFLAGGRPTR